MGEELLLQSAVDFNPIAVGILKVELADAIGPGGDGVLFSLPTAIGNMELIEGGGDIVEIGTRQPDMCRNGGGDLAGDGRYQMQFFAITQRKPADARLFGAIGHFGQVQDVAVKMGGAVYVLYI